MCLTIIVYSVFTALCGLAPGLLLFGIFRFLAGFGIGGEWAAGVSLLHESVPERVRVRYAGWLHTATPTGQILAAGASLLYPILGWRGLFLVGIVPALLTVYLRRRIPEPEKWQQRGTSDNRSDNAPGDQTARPSMRDLFRSPLARSTWPAALMLSCAIFGLWSTSFWAPTFVVSKIVAEGGARDAAQRLASFAGLAGAVGTMIACLLSPWIVARFGSRRGTGAFFFSGALLVAILTYGYAARVPHGLVLFMALLPVLGFFTNGVFALYSIWLPEMFPSVHRASGAGFAFSLGRILGAAGPTAVGALVGRTGSYPAAILLVSMIYVIGLPFTMWSPETARRPLPL
jgi:MFS family permease